MTDSLLSRPIGVAIPARGSNIRVVATGLLIVMAAVFLAARYFGMRQYGRIYGALYVPFGLSSALSPMAYGAVRDATGNYDAILTAAIGIFIVGGALLLTLGAYPRDTESTTA